MKKLYFTFLTILFCSLLVAQPTYKIMSYNLLNYPGSDTTSRNPYFRTTIASVLPDVLVVQEMTSQAGVNGFLNNVLNVVTSGYAAGSFIDGPDTDNAIFYKTNSFTFLANNPIATSLRDISEFVLRENISGDTLRIYSVHLKASEGTANEQQRLTEVTLLRNVTDALPLNSNFIVCGDFNIYSSTEPAYQKLKNQTTQGYFIDVINLTGSWNNSQYAPYHTQSPRVRSFGGGSTGGMDDRFDMILMSPAIINSGGITYLPSTYTAYGNDGLHYNDSINAPPNNAVGQTIANAIHYASDHIPVFVNFLFETSTILQFNITALIEGLFNGISIVPDTITIEIRSAFPPYNLIEQNKIFLNSSGSGNCNFSNAVNGTPYFFVIKHRSAIETWSSVPQSFSNSAINYDFTTASNKAYGNNLKLINGKWCIKGGDVNQDGFVNSADLNFVYSSNVSGFTGYNSTDLNGDNFTEIADLSIVFTNYILGVQRISPP